MMTLATLALAGLIGLTALVLAAHFLLKGWQGWLEVRKMEIAGGGAPRSDEPVSSSPAGGRIELADLKERVRKLEAIAAGIDL
jgi:hypothetical protein